MTTSAIPATKNLSLQAKSEAAAAKDNKFKLLYLPFHGVLTGLRAMFAMSDLEYEFIHSSVAYIDDAIAKNGLESQFPNTGTWTSDKLLTPFGTMPVLYIETKSQDVLEMSELSTIEYFLAEKMGLVGDNLWERQLVSMYHSNTQALFDKLVTTVVRAPKEHFEQMKEIYLSSIVPEWAQYHEQLLQDNGANGHYVGDKLTLADIKTATSIDNLISISGDRIISREKTPAIFAVYDSLEKNPKYAKWKASDLWKAYDTVSKTLLNF
ncbi:hypothetical protein BGW38_010512 [Lunasporangiospora selenospora]|uniref:Glutathione S-transferase n=1 Tax=Lunasporangiospora selenospora TaxID=979761 RepID=A0A9P6FX15_9FUNG|nr:hypothetical protein BGW38_010512 [Lunasporangiospora selenospora]